MESKKRTAGLIITIIMLLCIEPVFAAEASVPQQDSLSVAFTIEAPNIWMNEDVMVIVTASMTAAAGSVKKVEARAGKNGEWQDITDVMSFFISENCLVYVRVTDNNGATYIKTKQIANIDKTGPEANAFIQGEALVVEARDEASGIQSITVNGKQFDNPIDGKIALNLADYEETQDGQIYVQAYDTAGNSSITYTIPNTPQPSATAETSEGDTTVTPVDGSAIVLENSVKLSGEREFYTVATEGGKNFYIVVDKERTTGNNVYVLVDASESDMLEIAKGQGTSPIMADGAGNTVDDGQLSEMLANLINGEEEKASEEPAEVEPAATDAPPPEEEGGSGAGSLILIIVVMAGVGGVGFYLKIYKPKHSAPNADDDEGENGVEFEEEAHDENENEQDAQVIIKDVEEDEI